jgi:endo-1,3(4)-beta-glucanase
MTIRWLPFAVLLVLPGCGAPVASDPCLTGNGGCDSRAACASSDAGVTCACPAGFTTSGLTCVAVMVVDAGDPCLTGNGGCDARAACSSSDAGVTCACPAGFTTSGLTCVAVMGVDGGDPCATANGGCAAIATCTSTAGGRTCACPAGYAGDGVTCTDVDECLAASAPCGVNQACTNTPGSFTCACDPTPVVLDLDSPLAVGLPGWGRVTGQQTPSALWGSTTAPLPTNTSWQNLVLGSGGSRVDFLPYQVRAEPTWLDVAAAPPVTTQTLVSVPTERQVMLGAVQFDGSTVRHVTSYDLLSVTLQYRVTAGTMTAPLVFGMPYVTADYAGLRPMLLPGDFHFAQVNGVATPGTVAGTRFTLSLTDGTTWLLYSSSSVSLTWSSTAITASSAFTGTWRVALQPDAAAAAVLDAHAAAIPRSGTVETTVSCDLATLHVSWATTGSGPLLMVSMPHHRARLVTPTTTALSFATLSGPLVALEGSSWTLSEPLPAIDWSAPRPVAPVRGQAVHAALLADSTFVPDPGTVDVDTYFGGKQLAKLARLALIADELGEPALAATLRARLATPLGRWLDGVNGNPFVYDTTWGGVVTTQSLTDPLAQFGQGHYNDHHFHYGYLLYAAAVVAKQDPAFATAHRAQLLALVRDIANPSARDPNFPRFRMFDFFRGHSWAGGLEDHPDGQDQESTSEAVNAWYAVHLVGVALGDRRLSDLGRLLTALEVDSARTYWQISSNSTVYQGPFAANRCVGRLFETMATFDTFFGTEPWKVYGIQVIPWTPVSEALVSPTWVTDAWPLMHASITSGSPGFVDLLTMAHATIDPTAAWTELQAVTSFDDGNSRTNALWWAATR